MELGQVTLGDGRRVDTCVGGHPTGPAVLVQHGLPGSRLTALQAEEAAHECGVRLLSLSRPGFGQSSATPPSLAGRGRDAVEVATALGVDEFAVLGISFGAPFAAATAAMAPHRVTALGIVAGIGPWRELEPMDDPGSVEERAILELDDEGRTEEALQAYRAAGSTWFDDLRRRETDEELVRAFVALLEPSDGTTGEDFGYLDLSMRVRLARDIRESLTSYDGLAHDNIAVGRVWDIDPAAIKQPTFLWYGDADATVPASHARWWQDHIPHAQLTIRSGRGHGGTFLLHWADMFRELRAQ